MFGFALIWAALMANEAFAKGPRIVIFGDSLVAGYNLGQGEGYPDRLQAALDAKGIEATIVGAGVSGDTTSSGASRLDWSVPDGTDAVVLELGANDALRGLPPEITERNLTAMVERLKERGIKVLLMGMLAPPNMGEDYATAFNGIYPRLAKTYDVSLYPFFLDGVMTKPELMLGDGIHPNPKGVDVIVERTLPLIEALVSDFKETS